MTTPTHCPKCGTAFRAGRIPEESLAKGYYGPWDGKEERYFSRIIGLEYPGLYNGVTDWKCPDCEHVWPRFMESP